MKRPKDRFFKMTRTIIILSIFTRILSFFKDTLIASKIGCCFKADAYFVALAGIIVLAEVVGEGLSTSMVPILMKVETKEGKERKLVYVNNVLNIILILSLILVCLMWQLSPIIMKILARGFSREGLSLSIDLMRLGLPMIIFILIRSVFVAFLQSNHAFKSGAKSWIYNNSVYIIYLLFFNRYGVYGLMVGGILAYLSQLFLVIPASIDLGYKYEFFLDFKNTYLKELIIFLMPIVMSISINRVNVLIDKSIASNLPEGSVSYLNYADKIIQFILGIFITAIVTVLFPRISEEVSRGEWEESRQIMRKGMDIILGITLSATVVLMVFARPLVRILFQRGAFGAQATQVTSDILVYYALGLTGTALVLILTRIYYAIYDSKTPFFYTFAGVGLNFLLNIILSKYMGISGIALATSISATVVAILLLMDLQRKERSINS